MFATGNSSAQAGTFSRVFVVSEKLVDHRVMQELALRRKAGYDLARFYGQIQANDAFRLYTAAVYKSSLNKGTASERQFHAQVS